MKFGAYFYKTLGVLAMPILWIGLKEGVHISDRFLPHPIDVIHSFVDMWGALGLQTMDSLWRILAGYFLGCILAILLGAALYKSTAFRDTALPTLLTVRTIPSTATIPFFLLWFGFSEIGKMLIIVIGISFNMGIAVFQILHGMREKYVIAFNGFGFSRNTIPLSWLIRFALEGLLPTLRFSLTVAIGLSVVAEYMGSQSGLGYVIQSARTTFSFNIIVVCSILYGVIAWMLDNLIIRLWEYAIPWRQQQADVER